MRALQLISLLKTLYESQAMPSSGNLARPPQTEKWPMCGGIVHPEVSLSAPDGIRSSKFTSSSPIWLREELANERMIPLCWTRNKSTLRPNTEQVFRISCFQFAITVSVVVSRSIWSYTVRTFGSEPSLFLCRLQIMCNSEPMDLYPPRDSSQTKLSSWTVTAVGRIVNRRKG